jgi:type VI secretion system secreted protein Hcp
MSTTTHIKFDGIDGESTDKDHKGEIEAMSWSWGVSNAAPAGAGTGSAVGKATPGDFHFMHVYDKASPVLAKFCASGKRVKSAVLSARKAGEGQKDYLKITLSDVLITSVAASAGGEDVMESVALAYSKIAFAYQPQDPRGTLGTPVKFDWNIKAGTVT